MGGNELWCCSRQNCSFFRCRPYLRERCVKGVMWVMPQSGVCNEVFTAPPLDRGGRQFGRRPTAKILLLRRIGILVMARL